MPSVDVADLITVDEAIARLDATPVSPRLLRLCLHEAQGLHLAQDLLADRDYPPFDKSQMDGFACRAADAAQDEVCLRLAGEVAAGSDAGAVAPGQTVKIMTGAPLPSGADAVIPVELFQRAQGDMVYLRGPAVAGRYIARRGSDCPAGRVVLTRGQKLEAPQLAVAASVGAAMVDVFARPRVGVLATGDEIVPFDRAPVRSQIRNCNSIMLLSLLRRLGCQALDQGMVPDEPKAIRDAIARGLEQHDALFITGGMSMGQYDYVPVVLRELGVDLKITKLRIKPGKPFVFGVGPGSRFVFGLPGNPVSGFACTLRLGARLLARLAGGAPAEKWTSALLASDLAANGPREFYQPAILRGDGSVQPLQWKSSGDVFTLAQANCLLVRPEHAPPAPAGQAVRVLEMPS